MAATRFTQDELALEEINRQAEELKRKQREVAALPKKLERERREMETTLPPMADIAERERLRRYEEENASRREARNLQKAQNRSMFLFLLLCGCTAALIAWGFALMRG